MIKLLLTDIFATSLKVFLFVLSLGLLQACGAENNQETSKDSSVIGGCPTDFLMPKVVIFDAVTICATKNVDQRKINHAAAVTAQWLDNDQDGGGRTAPYQSIDRKSPGRVDVTGWL